MHIDDGASDDTNMEASTPMDSNLTAILEQIMELARVPSSLAYESASNLWSKPGQDSSIESDTKSDQ
jgi:hypothetical protein